MTGHIPTWSKNANIYEVNIRQYTPEGTFSAFKEHLPRLDKMGVDIILLMPIFPISQLNKQGNLGNPYSVSDYTAVNSELGSLGDFRELVRAIHNAGMKVILDFPSSQTGWDHPWVSEQPDYYVNPKLTGKTDITALNFSNKEMRKALVDEMLHWIQREKIDGYRMDNADAAPEDFWEYATYELKSARLDIFLIANSNNPALRNSKSFTTDYGSDLYEILNNIANGDSGPSNVVKWYKSNQKAYKQGWQTQYTSNHDLNSHQGTTDQRMGAAHKTLAALAYTIEGMPLIQGGQEEPLTHQLSSFEKDDIGFKNFKQETWFSRILEVKHTNQALWNGDFGGAVEFLQVDDQILSYKREKNGATVFCVFNLSDKPATYKVDRNLNRLNEITTRRVINFYKGADLNLQPWSCRIYSTI
jgi:glycosidase